MKKLNIPIIEVRDELNNVSPSFCIAKWKQVTLHLQNGHTHSCHHPRTHKVPLSELETNISALHNTDYKKIQRKKMLEGVRPSECDYCWRIEDSSETSLSDRTYKSAAAWAYPYLDEVVSNPWDYDVTPTYLEVSFSNVCNFKCSYCGPQFSSKWMEEIEKYGPYPTSQNFGNLAWLKHEDSMPIPHKDENPYVEAFWKWWPNIHHRLVNFRITGGEPLLSKDTFAILDWFIENPNPELELSINSNMCPPSAVLDKFIEKIKIICSENKVKQFKIFTSAEAHGAQAEYIRNGMDYDLWLANIHRILSEVPGCTFTVMSTYNALSVFSYTKFLSDILDIKLKYTPKDTQGSPIMIDIPYLRYPAHQAIFILPKTTLSLINEHISFMQDNVETTKNPYMGFFQFEIDKLTRIRDLFINTEERKDVTQDRIDFVKFVDEHDARRGTDFLVTFPEMRNLYTGWKQHAF